MSSIPFLAILFLAIEAPCTADTWDADTYEAWIKHRQAIIEAVYGLNQGLVDGDIDPDRWMLDRTSGRVLSHAPSSRERKAVPTEKGVVLAPLTPAERGQSP